MITDRHAHGLAGHDLRLLAEQCQSTKETVFGTFQRLPSVATAKGARRQIRHIDTRYSKTTWASGSYKDRRSISASWVIPAATTDTFWSLGYRQFAIPALHGLLVGDVTQDCLHAKTFVTLPLSRRWDAVLDASLRFEQRSSYAWTRAMEKAALGRSRHSPKNSPPSASCARSMSAAGTHSASCGPPRGDRRGRSRRRRAGCLPGWGRETRPNYLAKLGRK